MSDEQNREQLREYRRVVANAITELRGQVVRDKFISKTIVHAIDEQISKLTGEGTAVRLSDKDRAERVVSDLEETIEAIKATPPSVFKDRT